MSLPGDLKGPCKPALALENLFKVDVDAEKLDEIRKEKCHLATVRSLCCS